MDRNKLLPLIGILSACLIWLLVSMSGIVDSRLFPNLGSVISRIGRFIATGEIFSNALATFYRTLLGFGLAALAAVPIGLVIGSHAGIRRILQPMIEFFRSLPGTAMFPLFLLMFGIGDASKIAIAWFFSFWVIVANTAHGVVHSSKTRLKVAKSFKATRWQTFRHVVLMESLPQTCVGLRTALSLSLIAIVVSEMFIGSNVGLGQKVYDAYLTYEASDLYAWLVITGLMGFILNKACALIEERMLHWTGR